MEIVKVSTISQAISEKAQMVDDMDSAKKLWVSERDVWI